MSTEKIPYSVHSFMLPLRWDYLPSNYEMNLRKEQISFEERTDLKNFLKCLFQDNTKWERKFFRIDSKPENFNEYHYFHSYATQTIFDLQRVDEKTTANISDSKVMVYFELITDPQIDTFTITTLKDGNYKLILAGISLHVYNTGIAILTINIENHAYENKEAVLCINEFGRRIYPQFLSQHYPYTQAVKETFLADSIEITIAGMKELKDDFSEYSSIEDREVHHYNGNKYERSWVVKPPAYIRNLFGDTFSFIRADEKPDSIRFNILTDDRMFFQSWVGNDELSNILKEKVISKNIINDIDGKFVRLKIETEYPYLYDPDWHAFIFGDKSTPTIENKKMLSDLSAIHTYARWAGYGTLYGFSKDSFVGITNRSDFSAKIVTHMKTMYYQMAVLSLAQRASVLRFSAEVSNLADIARCNENEKLIPNIKILYKNYIEFINKIYYREITPYIQGIEMYSQFQKIMELKENVKDLDDELNELFNYVKLEEDEKQSNEAHTLSIVATWFLPASFIASLFGIGMITQESTTSIFRNSDMWIFWLVICATGFLMSWIILKFFKSKRNENA